MDDKYYLLVDLKQCIGCLACEIACKQEHNIPLGENFIRVMTIGPYEINGNMQMVFIPNIYDRCNLCVHRTAQGREPACVDICPTEALDLCSGEKTLAFLEAGSRYHVAKINNTI